MDGNQNLRQQQQGAEHTINMAEFALRGAATLYDIQMAMTRNLFQMQARSMAALGAPDCSELFRVADDRAKQLVKVGTEQVLNSVRQTSETVGEIQQQFGRLFEQQTAQLTEQIRHGIEEVTQRTQQGMQEVKELAQQQADEARRALEAAGRQSNGETRVEQGISDAGQQGRQTADALQKAAASRAPK